MSDYEQHSGEPNLEEERSNWLSLPEEERERIIAFITGTEVELSEDETAELMRNLRWNIIYLTKLLAKNDVEDEELKSWLHGQLDLFERAQRKIEMRTLERQLKKEQTE